MKFWEIDVKNRNDFLKFLEAMREGIKGVKEGIKGVKEGIKGVKEGIKA